jgi:hypothetical protein
MGVRLPWLVGVDFELAMHPPFSPGDWKYGASVGQVDEAPMPKREKILRWDTEQGLRVRR